MSLTHLLCLAALIIPWFQFFASSVPLPTVASDNTQMPLFEARMNRSLHAVRTYIAVLAQRVEEMQDLVHRSLMPECRHPWKVMADQLCLFKPPFKRAWLDGMFFCRSIGGQLVTLRNQAEWTAVQMLDLHNGLCPWIGLRFDEKRKAFGWDSGSNATFRKWEVGEPDRDDFYNRNVTANCVYACPTGMGDHDCGYHNEFVCEKRPQTRSKP